MVGVIDSDDAQRMVRLAGVNAVEAQVAAVAVRLAGEFGAGRDVPWGG